MYFPHSHFLRPKAARASEDRSRKKWHEYPCQQFKMEVALGGTCLLYAYMNITIKLEGTPGVCHEGAACIETFLIGLVRGGRCFPRKARVPSVRSYCPKRRSILSLILAICVFPYSINLLSIVLSAPPPVTWRRTKTNSLSCHSSCSVPLGTVSLSNAQLLEVPVYHPICSEYMCIYMYI